MIATVNVGNEKRYVKLSVEPGWADVAAEQR
jgi:hypothetical protein